MWLRIFLGGAAGVSAISTGLSLRNNDYNLNLIGIVRLSRSVATAYDIMQTYKRELYYRDWDFESPDYLLERNRVHQIAADKLLKLMNTNKGVYIKLGQHIGSLEYLLPKEFVKTMKILHSHAPENSVEDLHRVIWEDLGYLPVQLFTYFADEPLGTASLAQVHKAILRNGDVVAVKVQHPYVKGNSLVDLKTMEYLVKIMSYVFPDFKMQWLIDESKRNLVAELDFLNEAKNAETLRTQLKNFKWLKIPKIYWDLSSKRVLVMEYMEGGEVTDVNYIKEKNINPLAVANKIGKLYADMIFKTGFVHSDPHPGNILVRKNDKGKVEIIMLDHGLYAKLTNQFRYEYANFWLSILNFDVEAMKLHSEKLGVKGGGLYGLLACMVTGRPWTTLVRGIDTVKYTEAEKTHIQKNIEYSYITHVLQNVDHQMLLIFKTNDLLRSIDYALQTEQRMTSFWVMSISCVRSKFNELRARSKNPFERGSLFIQENWAIFKLNFYYLFLGIKNYGFIDSFKQIISNYLEMM